MRTFTSEAIVLGRKSWGEADRLITLFSRDKGKITLLAKGVKKVKSRKAGSLEIFSRIRFSATKSRGFPILTEVVKVNSFAKVRQSLKKIALAYYFAEISQKITREEEVNEKLFFLINNYLLKLGKAVKLKTLKREFIIDILVLLGFWPKNKEMGDEDLVLGEILERKLNSVRVGKKLFS